MPKDNRESVAEPGPCGTPPGTTLLYKQGQAKPHAVLLNAMLFQSQKLCHLSGLPQLAKGSHWCHREVQGQG